MVGVAQDRTVIADHVERRALLRHPASSRGQVTKRERGRHPAILAPSRATGPVFGNAVGRREPMGYNVRHALEDITMSDDVTLQGLVELLPPRIWYLTSNGQDMWCRRPYGFLFSTGQGAEAF